MYDRYEARPKGALCYPLNPVELASIIKQDLLNAGHTLNGEIDVYFSALVYGEGTKWAVVNTEGVGSSAEDYDGEVAVNYSIGAYDALIREHYLPFSIIDGLTLGTHDDLADFIRVFGDRLDRNHSLWYDFADKEEVRS